MILDPEKFDPYASADQVDPQLWADLAKRDPARVALITGANRIENGFRLTLIDHPYSVFPDRRKIERDDGREIGFQTGLALLCYLNAPAPAGLGGERVSFKSLSGGALFFTASHTLATEELAERLNLDRTRFAEIGRRLGAADTGRGEASWLIWALPQIPMEAFFFSGDDEFPPRIALVVDPAADRYFDLGVLWGVVNVLAERMTAIEREIRGGD